MAGGGGPAAVVHCGLMVHKQMSHKEAQITCSHVFQRDPMRSFVLIIGFTANTPSSRTCLCCDVLGYCTQERQAQRL